jgi:hypothetical protein
MASNPSTMDMTLLNELYEEIENNPPGIEARKLLIQQFLTAEWNDSALGAAQELLEIDPQDADAKSWVSILKDTSSTQSSAPSVGPQRISTPPIPADLELGKVQLYEDYEALRSQAKKLLRETTLLRDLTQQHAESTITDNGSSIMNILGSFFSTSRKKDEPITSRFEKHIPDLVALSNGRVSTVVRVRQPGSIRSVARAMEEKPDEAVDIAVSDLEDMARWLSSSTTQTSPLDSDAVREALVKRVQTLIAALHDDLKPHASTALMHVEHEVLQRTYICKETMYGDAVADIPRSHFLVTEDGYAWDMVCFSD